MSNPRFSIITICYNSEKTIERTIKSVLAQTFNDYEYLIVDGASVDNTVEIIKRYQPLFNGRLFFSSEPDKGIYDAMNKGIKKAKGDIVGILNSDDWLEKDALMTVNSIYCEHNKSDECLYCGGMYFHNNGVKKELKVNLNSFRRQAHLYIMPGIRHPATFVPKKIYERIGLFNDQMKMAADTDFILRCYYGGVHFVAINKMLTNMAAGGVSTSGDEKQVLYSKHDRELMLKGFGKKGLVYYWLFYSCMARNAIKRWVQKIGVRG